MNSQYIFTYGTLKKGFSNHGLIEHLEFIGEALTCEKYQMYPCTNYAFPFLLKSEKNIFIKGEVYKLNSIEDLNYLDELEGYPTLYLREEIDVILIKNSKTFKSIIYIKNEDEYKEYIDLKNPIKEWTRDISS